MGWLVEDSRVVLGFCFEREEPHLRCPVNPHTKAPYKGLCQHTAQQWQNLEVSEQIEQMLHVESTKPGFLTAKARDALQHTGRRHTGTMGNMYKMLWKLPKRL